VERTPDAIALVLEDQHLTYRELNARANCLAHSLRKLNVGPEVAVGVCLERSPEAVVSLLAVLKAGGVYCRWILPIRSSALNSCCATERFGAPDREAADSKTAGP